MLPVISIIIDRLKPRTKEFRTVYEFMITVDGGAMFFYDRRPFTGLSKWGTLCCLYKIDIGVFINAAYSPLL